MTRDIFLMTQNVKCQLLIPKVQNIHINLGELEQLQIRIYTNILEEWQCVPQGGVLPPLAVVVISDKLLSSSILHPDPLIHAHTLVCLRAGQALQRSQHVVTYTREQCCCWQSLPLRYCWCHLSAENLLRPLACQHGRDALSQKDFTLAKTRQLAFPCYLCGSVNEFSFLLKLE